MFWSFAMADHSRNHGKVLSSDADITSGTGPIRKSYT